MLSPRIGSRALVVAVFAHAIPACEPKEPKTREDARPSHPPDPKTKHSSESNRPAETPRPSRPTVRIKGGTYENTLRGYSSPPIHPSVGVAAKSITIDTLEVDLNEVTVAEYGECVKAGQCTPTDKVSKHCNDASKPDHPINCVSFAQAKAYCSYDGKRLLSDREWAALNVIDSQETREQTIRESCVTADSTSFCRGHFDTPPGTCPVGTHRSKAGSNSPHDLVGNVAEWTDGTYCSHKAHWCSSKVVSGLPWCATIHDPTTRRWLGPDANGPDSMTAKADWIGLRCVKTSEE